jgi:putative N6-adenine-specific DNA methylase
LEPILAQELHALGAASIDEGRGGVSFAGDLAVLYKANLWLRTAVRVLQPLLEVNVFSTDELYDAVRTIRWGEFMTVDHTLAVDCNVRDSAITHSQYAARRVKDAICDQFRDLTGGVRPSVDTEKPAIGLNLHISRNRMILSLDSSWDSLHKRGYRPIQTRAPLNEALAAGLLMNLNYDGTAPLVDWMCGSGTFLIEGLWIAQHRAPGLTRKWFSFFGRPDFDRALWAAIRDDARAKLIAKPDYPPTGSDMREDAVRFAEENASAAGVGNLLKFEKQEIGGAHPAFAEKPGLLICNPPYGERLGEEEELIPLYKRMGQKFAENWPGWRLAVFTSNNFLAKQIRLPVVHWMPFYNGGLECRLWEFASG